MSEPTISSKHLIVRGKENIVSDMGGEKVMLSVRNGRYYNLGEIGGKIWDNIEAPVSVDQVVDKLVSEYDVAQIKCKEEVVSFLELLLEEGLIHIEEVNP